MALSNTLRAMAWERAKGELRSMLATFGEENAPDWKRAEDSKKFDRLKSKMEEFIRSVEDAGLNE